MGAAVPEEVPLKVIKDHVRSRAGKKKSASRHFVVNLHNSKKKKLDEENGEQLTLVNM